MNAEELRARLPYRTGVGIMLVNHDNHVFVGQRYDNRVEAWQMPQGGVDPGEEPFAAALRELWEETGVRRELATPIAATLGFHQYDLPDELLGSVWHGKYRGQRQKWFAMRFLGQDGDIDLAADKHAPHPEFSSWRWVRTAELAGLIVPFKRALYRDVLAELVPKLGG